ncbi:MAG: hypothetical protein FRX49_01634 [Trebouxia sp. A1-2]|nr:MAG: hypothetical protein FRX49_01634 [Trebouxia sp. A1-2]
MSSDQHRQQIIPQLISRNFISRGNKEAQDAGVALIDVALFKTVADDKEAASRPCRCKASVRRYDSGNYATGANVTGADAL